MTLTVDAEVKAKVISVIDGMKDDIVRFCSDMVKISTVTPTYLGVNYDEVIGGEKKCNEFVAERLRRISCKIDMWEPVPQRANLVGTLKSEGGGKSLILMGHIDVVPPGKPELWTYPPFSGHVEDGKIHGRGASDCKAGIAAMIAAVEAIQKAGYTLKGDVLLESVIGEETGEGGAEGANPIGAVTTVSRGHKADGAIIAEAFEGIWVTQPHLFWMKVTVTGKTAHSMLRRDLIHAGGLGSTIGVSAVDKGFKVYETIRELERQWGITKKHPLLPHGHFTLGANVVRGGPGEILTPYIIPDVFTLDYCVWAHPQEEVAVVKKEIEDCINAVASADEWLRDHPPKVEWKLWWGPYNTPENHPLVKTVSDAYEQVTQTKPQLAGCPGVLDCTFLEAQGIPCVSHGPGGAGAATEHAENEFVVIDDIMRATKVLSLATLDWCGYEK
ncbi:MAG: ArgE/DapE family deacylase [Candidatus Bathyarchaeia archaeon]